MTTRKLEQKNIRNLQKVRKTYSVSLPVDLIREFGWKERQKVEVVKFGKDKILIKDWKKKRKDK